MKAKKTKKPAARPAPKKTARKAATRPTKARAAPKAVAKLTPPRLGAVWPGQGGRYAGIIAGENGQPDYHLIVAVPVGPEPRPRAWGPVNRVEGADSRRDGMANTLAMAKAGSALAQKVRVLKIDGKTDFYIGARDEARVAYANLREHMSDEWLWTSTQSEAYCDWAWLQHVGASGGQNRDLKSLEYRAFVLRRLPIR